MIHFCLAALAPVAFHVGDPGPEDEQRDLAAAVADPTGLSSKPKGQVRSRVAFCGYFNVSRMFLNIYHFLHEYGNLSSPNTRP